MPPPNPLAPDDLSEAERFLVQAVTRGEAADLKRHTIRGSVLRDLALEARPGWTVREAGIRVHKAIIDGGLDFEGCVLTKPLLLWHSRVQGGGDRGAVVIRDGKIKRLGIHSCTIDGAVVADRVEVENGLFLGGGLIRGVLQIRGGAVDGALAIEGTEVGDGKSAILAAGLALTGPVILRRARLKGEVAFPRAILDAGIYGEDAVIVREGVAVNGESARIGGDVLLDRANITGTLRLANARVGGQISGEGLVVAATPLAIVGTGLNVTQGVSLANGRIAGSIALEGAEIGKAFRLDGAEIWGGDTAIAADNIRVGGNWSMAQAKLVGSLSCPGAEVAGQMRMTEARVFGTDIAIRADGARIRGGCFLSRATVLGLLRFPAVEIGNQFRLRGATLKVERGAALLAAGATFNRDVELDGGLQSAGGLVFDQTRIRGTCDLSGSRLVSSALSPGEPAKSIEEGGSAPSTTAPAGTRQDEIALSLVDASVGRLVMPAAAADRPRGIVDLSRASVGSFVDYAAAWPPTPIGRGRSTDGRDIDHLVLDGFTYEHLANPAATRAGADGDADAASDTGVGARRVAWLEAQAAGDLAGHFKPQAWIELASRLEAQGYREEARTVTVARLRRERRSLSSTRGQRWQGRILDLFALYGLNPWRTVVWMVATILIFAGLWSWAASQCGAPGCFDESVFVVSNKDAYTGTELATYPEFNALGYSFDAFVPFVAFGYEDHWRPNVRWRPLAEVAIPLPAAVSGSDGPARLQATITGGGLLYVLLVVEMLLGLILTSLAVTGFTGLLRGSDSSR